VKVKEPLPSEYPAAATRADSVTYLHTGGEPAVDRGAVEIRGHRPGLRNPWEVNRRLPLLEPMSEIAGRMSVLVGGYFLAKHHGGQRACCSAACRASNVLWLYRHRGHIVLQAGSQNFQFFRFSGPK